MSGAPLKPASVEEFARLLAAGTEVGDAYRKSGVGALGHTVREAESRADVRARVTALRAADPEVEIGDETPTMATLTEDEILAKLEKARRMAHATGQAAPATRAVEIMAKMKGFLVERSVAVTATVDVPDLELAQRIAYLLTAAESKPVIDLLPAPVDVE